MLLCGSTAIVIISQWNRSPSWPWPTDRTWFHVDRASSLDWCPYYILIHWQTWPISPQCILKASSTVHCPFRCHLIYTQCPTNVTDWVSIQCPSMVHCPLFVGLSSNPKTLPHPYYADLYVVQCMVTTGQLYLLMHQLLVNCSCIYHQPIISTS